MVNKDVVLAKVRQIQNCLQRIEVVTGHDPETLAEFNTQDVFVLNLQRAVQACLDLASHVVMDENFGLPQSLKDNFILLQQHRILSEEECIALCKMVGFRNIAVHDYSRIEVEILKKILQTHLVDLEKFYIKILKFYKISPQ